MFPGKEQPDSQLGSDGMKQREKCSVRRACFESSEDDVGFLPTL